MKRIFISLLILLSAVCCFGYGNNLDFTQNFLALPGNTRQEVLKNISDASHYDLKEVNEYEIIAENNQPNLIGNYMTFHLGDGKVTSVDIDYYVLDNSKKNTYLLTVYMITSLLRPILRYTAIENNCVTYLFYNAEETLELECKINANDCTMKYTLQKHERLIF